MKTAVIVTTYNRPDALQVVLEGYREQTVGDFELLIADDGSRDETRALVADYSKRTRFPIHHVWQEDRGFRAGAARNRALAHTRADYVIFSDGDCVPPVFFVEQHRALAERGNFLSGNRILLSAAYTARLLEARAAIHRMSTPQWLIAWLRRDVNRALPLVRLPDGAFRKRHMLQWEGVKTCNFSAWRKDLVHVNGFDEQYSGWGLEDSDLVIRLLHAGVRHKSARYAAPVFHLWHHDNDRTQLAENQRRLDTILASEQVAAVVGLDQYSSP
ncbi:MAG: glycosyltransferase family 2 protein [Burkholderiales bacterium]